MTEDLNNKSNHTAPQTFRPYIGVAKNRKDKLKTIFYVEKLLYRISNSYCCKETENKVQKQKNVEEIKTPTKIVLLPRPFATFPCWGELFCGAYGFSKS
jgi:hypothetical protein